MVKKMGLYRVEGIDDLVVEDVRDAQRPSGRRTKRFKLHNFVNVDTTPVGGVLLKESPNPLENPGILVSREAFAEYLRQGRLVELPSRK